MHRFRVGIFCFLIALCMVARAQDVKFWLAYGDAPFANNNGLAVGDPLQTSAPNNVVGLDHIRVRLMATAQKDATYPTGGVMLALDSAGSGPIDFATPAAFDAAATFHVLRMNGLTQNADFFTATGLPGQDNAGTAMPVDVSVIGSPKLSCALQKTTGPRDIGFWAGYGFGLAKNLTLTSGQTVQLFEFVIEVNQASLLFLGGTYGDQADHTGLRIIGDPTATSRKTYLGLTSGTGNATTATYSLITSVIGSSPVAIPDAYSTNEDTTLNVGSPGVLTNDTDPDAGDTITARLQTAPAHAAAFTLNANGSFSYTPVANYAGTDSFTYRAVDQNNNASLATTCTITVNPVNDPPRVGQPSNVSSNELNVGTLQISADDATDNPPNLPLKYSLTSGPTGMTMDANGLISWTPTEEQGPGDYSVTVLVEDSGTPVLGTSITFSWHVNEINQAPKLSEFTPVRTYPGATFTVQAVATDDDLPAQNLTYSLVGAILGASINPNTGLFTYVVPGDAEFGPISITISVSDKFSPVPGTDTKVLKVHIAHEQNQAPILDPIGAKSTPATVPLQFTATASDPDKDALTFSIDSGPAGATIDPTTGKFKWTPTAADIGSHECTIRVTEVGIDPALFDFEQFTITVFDAPAPISGKVTLRDFIGTLSSEVLTFEIRDSNNQVVETIPNVALDSDGKFGFTTTLTGSFAIVARGRTWISQARYPISIVSSTPSVVNYALNNGDCNGDNTVTLEDKAIIDNAYDTAIGSSGYDPRADLDGSGYVGTDDYLILSDNYGQEGQ